MEDVTPLISIEEAKRHIKDTSGVAATEADIQSKLDQATKFVERVCGALWDASWDETTVPAPVYTAILLHLTELYGERGDTERERPFGQDAVRYLMATGYRDPVVA